MAVAPFDEVGDGCYRRRYQRWDVNVGVVRGSDALLVVDTRGSHAEARELLDELRRFGPLPVRWVVNTHWHYDHTFGNREFARQRAELWGHRTVPAMLNRWPAEVVASLVPAHPDLAAELEEVEAAAPDRLVDDTASIDLGDRTVELQWFGRGHTDGDLVATVPGADVVFAGDLVEESGPPAYGDDSFPLEWPATASRLLDALGPATRVVPGHGDSVDRRFVADQAEGVGAVAGLLRELHAGGVPARDAIAEGGDRWPFPSERLAEAVLRAYAALAPANVRSLGAESVTNDRTFETGTGTQARFEDRG